MGIQPSHGPLTCDKVPNIISTPLFHKILFINEIDLLGLYLENFATIFDQYAAQVIGDRKAEFMISAEESVDDSGGIYERNASKSSPKLELHNNLLDRFKGSKPAKKMFLFQNANLINATDDDHTSGTVQINKVQAHILQQVTKIKGLSLSSITAQKKSGTLCPNSMDESETEHNARTNNSFSSDDESITTETTAETNKIANGNKREDIIPISVSGSPVTAIFASTSVNNVRTT